MNAIFSAREGLALFRLLAGNATDFLLKIDCGGTIVHTLPANPPTGSVLPGEWIGRDLAELAAPGHAGEVAARHRAAVSGVIDDSWFELPIRPGGDGEHWFEARMVPLTGRKGDIYGVLAVLRSIEERKRFEQELFAASLTDPLTGLTNRTAFVSMLDHLIGQEGDAGAGCVALFDIDHFKAVNIRYGQSVGDRVLVAFAHFVRSAMRERDIVSRVGGESLGVLLPGANPAQAEAVCRRVVASIGEIGSGGEGGSLAVPITASAGVARIAGSVDETLRSAEVALALAKAKGRNRLEMAA